MEEGLQTQSAGLSIPTIMILVSKRFQNRLLTRIIIVGIDIF
ncbi:hypothetical protein [Reticulibacter mediterranei]|nr:hypothetical protein [Reticulibacter mediterranei]